MRAIGSVVRRAAPRIHSEAGAIASEYGLVLMLVALAIILAVGAYGLAVSGLFEEGPDAFP